MSERLRFSPSILARLGEELLPDADQGVIELVKNAYDAEAKGLLDVKIDTERTSVDLRRAQLGEVQQTTTEAGFLHHPIQLRDCAIEFGGELRDVESGLHDSSFADWRSRIVDIIYLQLAYANPHGQADGRD